jgi:TPR repeat protein
VLQESGLCNRPAEVAKVVEALARWESSEDTDVLEALVEVYELANRAEDATEIQHRIDAEYERFRTESETRTARELALLRPAAEAGNPQALRELAILLRDPLVGDQDAIRYFQRAAEAGDARAWSDAAWSMRNQHRLEEAVTWLREAVEAGHTSALYPAAQMLEQSNDLPAAIEYYRRAAEAGHPHGHNLFARLSLEYAKALRKADDLDGAVTHGRNSAEAGERYAWPTTATYLVDSGRATEAFAWLRRHAEAGNVDAAQQLAWQAMRAHDLVLADEALASLRAHAEAGDKTALAAIPHLLLALDRPEEAFAAELWATEAGCVGVRYPFHRLDLPQRFAADLERMHKYGLEPGGKVSSGWTPGLDR